MALVVLGIVTEQRLLGGARSLESGTDGDRGGGPVRGGSSDAAPVAGPLPD